MDVLELVRKVRSLDESLLPKSYKVKAEKVLAEGLSSIESAETDEEKKEMVTRAMALVQQILNVVEANRTLKASLLDPMSITAQEEEEAEEPEDLEAEEGDEIAEEEGSEEPAEDLEEDEDFEDEDLGDDLDQIQAEVDELLSELDAEESEEPMPDLPEVDEELTLEEAPAEEEAGELSEDGGEELSLETGEEDLSLDDNDLALEDGGDESDFEDITPELESDAEAELDLMDQEEGASGEEDLGGEIDGDAEILEDMDEGEGESMPDPMKIESSKSNKKSFKDEVHQHVNELLKDLI